MNLFVKINPTTAVNTRYICCVLRDKHGALKIFTVEDDTSGNAYTVDKEHEKQFLDVLSDDTMQRNIEL